MFRRTLTLITALALAALGCSKSEENKEAPMAPEKSPVAGKEAEPSPKPPTAHPDPSPPAAGDTHEAGEHRGDHGGPEAPLAEPASLKEAVTALDATYQELAGIVKDGDLSKAHHTADRLGKLGAGLPELATKAGLGAAEARAITIAGKKLGLLFRDMDEAGDSGNRAQAQKVFARYEEPMTTIKAKAALAK